MLNNVGTLIYALHLVIVFYVAADEFEREKQSSREEFASLSVAGSRSPAKNSSFRNGHLTLSDRNEVKDLRSKELYSLSPVNDPNSININVILPNEFQKQRVTGVEMLRNNNGIDERLIRDSYYYDTSNNSFDEQRPQSYDYRLPPPPHDHRDPPPPPPPHDHRYPPPPPPPHDHRYPPPPPPPHDHRYPPPPPDHGYPPPPPPPPPPPSPSQYYDRLSYYDKEYKQPTPPPSDYVSKYRDDRQTRQSFYDDSSYHRGPPPPPPHGRGPPPPPPHERGPPPPPPHGRGPPPPPPHGWGPPPPPPHEWGPPPPPPHQRGPPHQPPPQYDTFSPDHDGPPPRHGGPPSNQRGPSRYEERPPMHHDGPPIYRNDPPRPQFDSYQDKQKPYSYSSPETRPSNRPAPYRPSFNDERSSDSNQDQSSAYDYTQYAKQSSFDTQSETTRRTNSAKPSKLVNLQANTPNVGYRVSDDSSNSGKHLLDIRFAEDIRKDQKATKMSLPIEETVASRPLIPIWFQAPAVIPEN